ncbi:MAG: TetR/AcrR family transcriptional regulator [Solirubrobacterales bacterium]
MPVESNVEAESMLEIAETRNTHLPGFDLKRREILAGAARVFDRRGFTAGTTKEVAAEVDLSQPAIYHYVGSKDALLTEIALQVARDMLAAVESGLDAGSTPREQLRSVVREFTNAVLRNQVEFAVYWKELNSLPPEVRTSVEQGERYFLSRVADLVGQLQASGELPSDAPRAAVTEGIIGMVCWTYHWYRPTKSLSPDALAEMFCDLVGLSDP